MKVLWVSAIAVSLLGCSNKLPSCGAKETKKVIENIVNKKSGNLGKFVELQEIEEEAYNKERQLRTCFATLVTMEITEDIAYSIHWENNKKRNFGAVVD